MNAPTVDGGTGDTGMSDARNDEPATALADPALHRAVATLHETLLVERAALEARDAEVLSSLCQRKRQHVLALERVLASPRVSGTAPAPVTAALLRECRELNAANAAGVAVRLAGVRRALVRLARLSGIDESWGYAADGAPSRPLRGRRLGEG